METMSGQVAYWLFYVIYLLHTSPLMAENIAVYNQHDIVCVADKDSTVFFDPPRKLEDSSSPILVGGDWEKETSTTSYFGSVTDKRWEDFSVVQEMSVNFTLKRSLAFSVYRKEINELKIYVSDDDYMEMDEINISKYNQSWIHFHIILKNKNVYLYENNELVTILTNFIPNEFEAHTDMATYWKIHEYTWQFTDTASTNWTRINVTDTCLTLYASTCPYCFIDVSTSTGKTYQLKSSNSETTWSWTSQKIVFENEDNNYIDLFRSRDNNNTDNYWALDIRQCPKEIKSGRVIYEKTLKEKLAEETFCSTLDDQNIYTNKSESSICERGQLGENCDIACEELIHNEFCENRKICHDQNCTCAWGCEGEYCQQMSCPQKLRQKRAIENFENKCKDNEVDKANEVDNDNDVESDERWPHVIKRSRTKKIVVAGIIEFLLGTIFLVSMILINYKVRKDKNSNNSQNVELQERNECGESLI